jgi:hypothetical protein
MASQPFGLAKQSRTFYAPVLAQKKGYRRRRGVKLDCFAEAKASARNDGDPMRLYQDTLGVTNY